MLPIETIAAFLFTAAVFVLSPGPGVLFVIGTGLTHGVARSLIAICGMLFMHVLFLSVTYFGLVALISASASVYEAIKYAGAAYLVFLGVRAWRAHPEMAAQRAGNGGGRRLFLQGMATSGTNPKSLMFYLALFPQFVQPGSGGEQFLSLSAMLLGCLAAGLTLYATLARQVRDWLLVGDRLRLQNRIVGAIFVLAGLALAGLGN